MSETTVMTITNFLLARIAEDEASVITMDCSCDHRDEGHPQPLANCPERVLAECEAKRRIVERHRIRKFWRPGGADHLCTHCRDLWPCSDLRDLAAVYADHPDYRDEWRP